MITIPALPTDSLYKFLFVSGIILMIFSFYEINKTAELSRKDFFYVDTLTSHNEIRVNEADKITDSLVSASHQINKNFNLSKDSLTKLFKGVKSKERLNLFNKKLSKLYYLKTQQLNNLSTLIDRSSNASKKTDIPLQRNEDALKQWQYFHDKDLENLKRLSKLAYLGLFLIFFGGVMWYEKIQKRQDAILKLQYEQLKKETEKSNLTGRKHFEPQILPRKR